MILSGTEIKNAVRLGEITIRPFNPAHLNPNSYNYRLGPELKVALENEDGVSFQTVMIPESGFVLRPQTLYLGHTAERIGSSKYAMSLIGRSSIGRLGMFLQISANLGHTGSDHHWTLEIYTCRPIRIYPYMKIGQISFWTNIGQQGQFEQHYTHFNSPQPSAAFPLQTQKGPLNSSKFLKTDLELE